MKNIARYVFYALAGAALLVATAAMYFPSGGTPAKISTFGKYKGYTAALYDGTQRRSDYLALPGGTRLAYDLILPTKNGVVADHPLPVLFKYTPYLRTLTVFDANGNNLIAPLYRMPLLQRAFLRVRYWLNPVSGRLMGPLFRDKWLARMVSHGYAAVVVEQPGTGASFGKFDASFEAAIRETDAIIDWIVTQKWCDGNVGMYGDSWQAQVQLAAAASGNPHLKAVMPISTWFDQYSAVSYPGGVKNKAFAGFFTWAMNFLDSSVVTPVDSDRDGKLLAQARADRGRRRVSQMVDTAIDTYPFRDSQSATGAPSPWSEAFMPYAFIDRINRASVPMYLSTGWYDIFTRDTFLLYANLTVPKRLMVRPLDHSQTPKRAFDLDFGQEAQRWFDYWLKGIKNGVMDGSPIHYYLMDADKEHAWHTADVWPLKDQKATPYYFVVGGANPPASANNGALQPQPPAAGNAADAHVVDYTTTTGKNSRWTAVNWLHRYPDMRTHDAKALTYTTAPLAAATSLVGHPIVHLWLRSRAPDLDAFVYLEEVDAKGRSTYVTEGNLRASSRALSEPPFDNLGLPYHSFFERDRSPLPSDEPAELVFDLLPTAYRFAPGKRIRVTIAFADRDNFDTPVLNPPPSVQVLRNAAYPSSVDLPIVQAAAASAHAPPATDVAPRTPPPHTPSEPPSSPPASTTH